MRHDQLYFQSHSFRRAPDWWHPPTRRDAKIEVPTEALGAVPVGTADLGE
jgi:hypothetical protein